MKRKILAVCLVIIIVVSCCMFCGCNFKEGWDNFWAIFAQDSFSSQWKKTEDGFSYYVDDEIGLCIMVLPVKEEVTIPEYIDGKKVVQLGYKDKPSIGFSGDYGVRSNCIKKLTITHEMNLYGASNESYTEFNTLEELVFIDCWTAYVRKISNSTVRIDFATQNESNWKWVHPEIHLLKGEKGINWDKPNVDTIEISECVTVIEKGAFDGIENVIIKTPYQTKPEGWAEGWNSDLSVEWGVEL